MTFEEIITLPDIEAQRPALIQYILEHPKVKLLAPIPLITG